MSKPIIQIWNTDKEGIYQVDIDTKIITKDKGYELMENLSNIYFDKESEVAELKEEIIRIKNIADSNFKSSEWNSDKWRELRDENEKLQKENEGLKISNNQMKASAIMKENKRLNEICQLNEDQKKENTNKIITLQKEIQTWKQTYERDTKQYQKENEILKIKNENLETDINAVRIAANDIISQKDKEWEEKIKKYKKGIEEIRSFIANYQIRRHEHQITNIYEICNELLNIKED